MALTFRGRAGPRKRNHGTGVYATVLTYVFSLRITDVGSRHSNFHTRLVCRNAVERGFSPLKGSLMRCFVWCRRWPGAVLALSGVVGCVSIGYGAGEKSLQGAQTRPIMPNTKESRVAFTRERASQPARHAGLFSFCGNSATITIQGDHGGNWRCANDAFLDKRRSAELSSWGCESCLCGPARTKRSWSSWFVGVPPRLRLA